MVVDYRQGVSIYQDAVDGRTVVWTRVIHFAAADDGVFGVAGYFVGSSFPFANGGDGVVGVGFEGTVNICLHQVAFVVSPCGILLQAENIGSTCFQVVQYRIALLAFLAAVKGHDVV